MFDKIFGLFKGADPVAGRREFDQVAIFERVLDIAGRDKRGRDTGGRTIALDNVATVSVGTVSYWWLRLVFWLIAIVLVLLTLGSFFAAYSNEFLRSTLLITGLVQAIVAAMCVFIARWLRDVTYLSVGAGDGSVTVFRSTNKAYLAEMRAFLTKKINERDTSAKLLADFKNAQSHPITVNQYIGAVYHGPIVSGSNNVVGTDNATVMTGSGNTAVRAQNVSGLRVATAETKYTATNSPGAQLGKAHTAIGNQSTAVMVDYSAVLPHVEEWQRYAAGNQGWEQVADKITELEMLLRSGTPAPEQKGKVRNLAIDLSTILQGYPAAVQLFQAVTRAAGF